MAKPANQQRCWDCHILQNGSSQQRRQVSQPLDQEGPCSWDAVLSGGNGPGLESDLARWLVRFWELWTAIDFWVLTELLFLSHERFSFPGKRRKRLFISLTGSGGHSRDLFTTRSCGSSENSVSKSLEISDLWVCVFIIYNQLLSLQTFTEWLSGLVRWQVSWACGKVGMRPPGQGSAIWYKAQVPNAWVAGRCWSAVC